MLRVSKARIFSFIEEKAEYCTDVSEERKSPLFRRHRKSFEHILVPKRMLEEGSKQRRHIKVP